VQQMKDRRIPKKILAHHPKRRRNIERPQLIWRTSKPVKRTDQTTHGLIHDDDDDDDDDDYLIGRTCSTHEANENCVQILVGNA
jgi:hypothetical protein